MERGIFHRTVQLPRSDAAPAVAREAIDAAAELLDERQLSDARLLATELASNAVRHGRGQIKLDVHLEGGNLCVAVEDAGSEQPRIRAAAGSKGGWGLRVVDALADEWGSEAGSSHVWFILRRR